MISSTISFSERSILTVIASPGSPSPGSSRRGELAGQYCFRGKVAVPLPQALVNQVVTSLQVNKPGLAGDVKLIAITPLERRAGQHDVPAFRGPAFHGLASDFNQGARSASSNGIPDLIFSTFAGEWKLSASTNSQPSRRASRTPMVVFPAPVTPITTTITGTRQEIRQGKACLSLLSPIGEIREGR